MDEYPLLELHHEGLVTKAQVVTFRGHRKALHGALNGVPALIQLRIERQDVDDERAVLVKPGLLLDDDGVLILYPGFENTSAVINGITPRIMLVLFETEKDSIHCAAVYTEVRNVNLQLIAGLLVCIGGVKTELGIQDHIVFCLVILEGDLAGTEIIPCTVEHSNSI